MVVHAVGRAALGAVVLAALPAAAMHSDYPLLARLEAGQWELRAASGGQIGSLCLGNRLLLAQPQHGAAACTHNLVSGDDRAMTVRYTCPAGGFGQTTIRYETPRLVQIDSQGVRQGTPFALRAEARRLGDCR